jgi:hypothetical protein
MLLLSLYGVAAGAGHQQQWQMRQQQQMLSSSQKQLQRQKSAMLRWLVVALSKHSRMQLRTQMVRLLARGARGAGLLQQQGQLAASASVLQLAMMLRRRRIKQAA